MKSPDKKLTRRINRALTYKDHESVTVSLTSAILLTATIFVMELAGGWWTGSLALIADATHRAVDLLGLSLSLFASIHSRTPMDAQKTNVYRRNEVFAALGNAIALLVATGFILREAWSRWILPTPIAGSMMLGIALIGLICNIGSAALLWRSNPGNINVRSALLHVLSDALGSVGALLAAIVISLTHWYEIDAIVSAIICVGIVLTAFWLLRDSIQILLEGDHQ